jgi:hypothetical protein
MLVKSSFQKGKAPEEDESLGAFVVFSLDLKIAD